MRTRVTGPAWSPWLEGSLVMLVGLVVAGLSFWPLPTQLGSHIAKDLSDPVLQAWQVAWGGHALLHQPFDYFQSNTFYPLSNSLAFSDALVGYAPTGLIGSGFEAALVRYNLLFLFSYAMAATGAYLLARELGLSRPAAAVAGAAFAYAPWRLEQSAHLHVVSSGGLPLALFLLTRGLRRRSAGIVVAGWLVATWQLSLGFNLGLPLAYIVAAAILVALIVWLRRGRPALERRMVWANVAGVAVFFGVAIALAQPYLAVVHDHPEARRTIAELKLFSPPPRGFFAAPADNFIWGGLTSGVRDDLSWPPEQVLFPGLAIVALAAAGAFFAPWPRRARVGLVVAAAAATLLATGVSIADGWLGYRWLYELAPGWNGLRTPGRLNTLGSLALAVLAAGGAQAAIAAAQRRRAWAGTALGLVLAAAIVVEGLGPPPINRVPDPPAGLTTVADPQMHLPLGTAGFLYMLWSVDGFPRIANGGSGFVPRQYAELADVVKTFPDRRSVAYLRGLGIESVVVHTSLGAPVPPVARTRALGLRGRLIGGAIVYRIPG